MICKEPGCGKPTGKPHYRYCDEHFRSRNGHKPKPPVVVTPKPEVVSPYIQGEIFERLTPAQYFGRMRERRERRRRERLQRAKGLTVELVRGMRTEVICGCSSETPHVKLALKNGELICPIALALRMVINGNFADDQIVNRVLKEARCASPS